MPERRSEPRLMCSDLVKVVVHDTPTEENDLVAILEDISPSGACLQVEEGIRVGTDIEVLCSACHLRGKVRYCRFVAPGYDVGIAFDPEESWVRRRFKPEHLLDIPSPEEVQKG